MQGALRVVIPVCLGATVFVVLIAVVVVRCYLNWRKQKKKQYLVNNSLHMLALSTQPLDFVPLLIQERVKWEEAGEEEADRFECVSSACDVSNTSREEVSSCQRTRKKSELNKERNSLKRRSASDTSLYTFGERFPDLDPSGPITSLRRESQFFDAPLGRGRSLTSTSTHSDGSENDASFRPRSPALARTPFSAKTLARTRKHPVVVRRASENVLSMSRNTPAKRGLPSIVGRDAPHSTAYQRRFSSATTKPSYAERTMTSKKRKTPVKRGQVDFRATYLGDEHKLEVHLINATELPMKNGHLLDSFARLSLRTPSKHQRVQSNVHKKTCNPIFDQKFVFDNVSFADLPQTWLKIKLLNRDSISRFERIGETLVVLSDEGLLRGETVSRELVEKAKKNQCLGELLVAVCHHATSSQLKVSVMKLKDVPKSMKSIFVTLELTHQGHVLQKHQTKTRRKNPAFNEEFSFVVSTDSSCTLENFGVQFTVIQRDFVHGNDVIGRVRLGMDAPLQSEVDHWRAIVLSPHKSIANWHHLHDNL